MVIAEESVAIKVIKESVDELLPGSSIVLFGSRARHENSADSDYDLMIITDTPHDNKEQRLLKALIRKKLARNKIPADVIIQSKAEVEINSQIFGHIVHQALKEGVAL